MKFTYTGYTRQMQEVSGTLEATSEMDARGKLRVMQIRPTDLYEGEGAKAFDLNQFIKKLTPGGSVKLKKLMVFTRQFSSLIDSGIAVVQCLDILQAQEANPYFKKVLLNIKEEIEGGKSLAGAMQRYPKVFSDFFVRVVEAGEMSGTLDTAMRRVGQQLDKLGKLRSKVISALTYPGATLVVAIIVLVFMLIKVIPEVAKLYADNEARLPDITLFVLGLSKWMENNFVIGLSGAFALFVGANVAFRIEAFNDLFDRVILRVPLFGSLIIKSTIAKLTRTLATLITSGVPLLPAFDICAKLVGNRAIRQIVVRASSAVQEGKSMAVGLSSQSNVFPPMVIQMVNIGEMTGRLDELLIKVADIYDDEVDDAVGALTGLLQPTLIVFVGGVIAFLLIAMYLPIFQLADKVAG